MNVFAKLVLLQVINDFAASTTKDDSNFGRMFAYFLRLVLNEFKDNNFIMSLIVLVLFKQRIHKDLYGIAVESVKNEVLFLKDKKFKQIFDERDIETMQV